MITTREDKRVDVALEKMVHGRFRRLPVICHEKLVGLVSSGDGVKHRLAASFLTQMENRFVATEELGCLWSKVWRPPVSYPALSPNRPSFRLKALLHPGGTRS